MFRLLPNLAALRVLAVCGGKDDPELVWNLREVLRCGKEFGFAIDYWEDPASGHDQPLPGEHEGGMALLATPAAGPPPARGVLLADGPHVEHPLFRVDEVDASKCAIPDRVAVSPRLSGDEQRRATLRALAGAVAVEDVVLQVDVIFGRRDGVENRKVGGTPVDKLLHRCRR